MSEINPPPFTYSPKIKLAIEPPNLLFFLLKGLSISILIWGGGGGSIFGFCLEKIFLTSVVWSCMNSLDDEGFSHHMQPKLQSEIDAPSLTYTSK